MHWHSKVVQQAFSHYASKISAGYMILAITSITATEASGKSGYFLQQRSNFLGQREVYLTDSGFMAINHVSGHILANKAPDWNVRVANLKSKLYFITPFDTWMGRKVAMGEKAVRGLTTSFSCRNCLRFLWK